MQRFLAAGIVYTFKTRPQNQKVLRTTGNRQSCFFRFHNSQSLHPQGEQGNTGGLGGIGGTGSHPQPQLLSQSQPV